MKVSPLFALALAGCHFVLDFGTEVVDGAATDAPAGTDAGGDSVVVMPADATQVDVLPDAVSAIGCADGVRDGFIDTSMETGTIAACAGGFSLPGVLNEMPPACGRTAGDDGANPGGAGCNAMDLCAAGWHVCASPADVTASSGGRGCAGSVSLASPPSFFATRQSGPGGAACGAGANDLFGCGNLGAVPAASCQPLDVFSGDLCASIGPPWTCGLDGLAEAVNVSKAGPDGGGVLCCRDP